MGKSWLTKSFLFIALCSFSFVLAILIYIVFYFLMIPPTFYRMPLFFDFSSPYPVAMVKLPCKKLRYMNQLEGTLHVCFPDSPRNMNLGMLKFTLELLDTHETLFYSRFRPTILRYKNDLEIKMETWTQLVFLLFGWKKRQQCQSLVLLEYKEVSGDGFLRRCKEDLILRIWINKADVEVYHSELLLKGRLRVDLIIHHHW
ncbi:hypothetical protein Gasu_44790 isoform 2 [Galdieria sulphuraria]|uniref:Uncharacterized protein n=1 Tax=Galdieria sulphuraria TaxID=130081 RepID=M2WVG5_GALSU|nr:hypothetical protein Gasu_44790 isoform 2 [Galdieria sulphuraria]EME27975.1 hypothetical protein isoform 2 [Galdieria sulphuraria]|eukprot:XP_005704495.1 hypothetical protein isoform 2 [Galdieria sulphuraria]